MDKDLSSTPLKLANKECAHEGNNGSSTDVVGDSAPSTNEVPPSSSSLPPSSLPLLSTSGDGKDHGLREDRGLMPTAMGPQHHPLAMTSMASCPPYPAAAAHCGDNTNDNSNEPSITSAHQPRTATAASASSSINFINNYISEFQKLHNNSNRNFFPSIATPANTDGVSDGNGGNASMYAIAPTGYDFSSCQRNLTNNPHIASSQAAAAVVGATAASAVTNQSNKFANHLHELRSNFQDSFSAIPTQPMSLPMQIQMMLMQQQQQQQNHQQNHYGISVNGFHPQVNAQTNHIDLQLPPFLLATATAAAQVGGLDGNFQCQPMRHQPHQNPQTTCTLTSADITLPACPIPASKATNTESQFGPALALSAGDTNVGIDYGNSRSCVPETKSSRDKVNSSMDISSFSDHKILPLLKTINPTNTTTPDDRVHTNNIINNSNIISTNTVNSLSVAAASSNVSQTAVHSRNSRDRNEREQVRAKKITQLIADIRDNIQGGGWREEMKSKYQVLSQCREYMEHLKRAHRAKEADIAHTKKMFEERQRRRQRAASLVDVLPETEKDPASETSSVSGCTAVCTSTGVSNPSKSDKLDTSTMGNTRKQGKRKRSPRQFGDDIVDNESQQYPRSISKKESCESQSDMKGSEDSNEHCKGRGGRRALGELLLSSTETSSISEDDNEYSLGGRNVSFHKDSSNLSDVTDSNQSGTEGGSGGEANISSKTEKGDVSTSSISSTAAVVLGLESYENSEPTRHIRYARSKVHQAFVNESSNSTSNDPDNASVAADLNKNHKKKRRGFHYDYREVFLKSNIPQLIATLSGRIVVWNEFFLKATGLSDRETKRLTIFSIVQPSELSNLYKMVARALAEKSDTSTVGLSRTISVTREWQAITLKCIPFPNIIKNQDSTQSKMSPSPASGPQPLSITVALMEDTSRDQRCFHCILTDCPSTNGRLGSVTPELFSKLYDVTGVKDKFVGVIAK